MVPKGREDLSMLIRADRVIEGQLRCPRGADAERVI
jgi:hypothetical protein